MSPLEVAGLSVFILFLFLGVFSTLFGLPGTLIILSDVIIYALVTGFERIGFKVIGLLILMAILAEALEMGLNVIGAAQFGASKRALWASVIGGLIGAMVMTPVLYGLGILLGMFLGGFLGVFSVELMRQNRFKPALRAGYGALLGRVAGILTKGSIAVVMVVITLMNIYS